jgi:hypothetical protein
MPAEPAIDAERLSLVTTGVIDCVAEESESPPGPVPDTELSRLNNPIHEFFCLGFAIPPTLTIRFHFVTENRSERQVILEEGECVNEAGNGENLQAI